MKRHQKPFSVEIKKSRVQDQRHYLPPRRLFELPPAKATPIFQEEVPQTMAKPLAAPRILPSILEPARSNSEAVEPVRRRSSRRSKSNQAQMDLDLRATAAEGVIGRPAEAPVMLEAVSRTDASLVEDVGAPALEVQAQKTEGTNAMARKPRKKASKIVEPVTAHDPVSEPETISKAQVIEPPLVNRLLQADHRRLNRRQAAAAQLLRHERWKRRLHSAVW
jgi:hypothetical protein